MLAPGAEGGGVGKAVSTVIGSVLPSIVSAFTSGGPRRQFRWNRRAAVLQNEMNRANAQWALDQEKRIQEEQRAYDSPAAQMQRFIEAGLNPHMIYGGGSANSGGAFPFHAPQIPGVNVQAPDASYPDIAGSYIAASQAQSLMGLQAAKTAESVQKAALTQIQADIAKTNPMLQPWVSEWVATSMSETARLKTLEARSWMTSKNDVLKITQKVNAELEAAMQRIGLNTTDLAIKNRILESKEFENMIKEFQVKWLKDSDVTPEHIRQALMLVLSKMVGR